MLSMKLQSVQTYLVSETKHKSDLLAARVRPVLSAPAVDWPLTEGWLEGLTVLVLSGKHKMTQVTLPPCHLRMANVRKCYCTAYDFPHAPSFGKCKGDETQQQAPATLDLNSLFIKGESDDA